MRLRRSKMTLDSAAFSSEVPREGRRWGSFRMWRLRNGVASHGFVY